MSALSIIFDVEMEVNHPPYIKQSNKSPSSIYVPKFCPNNLSQTFFLPSLPILTGFSPGSLSLLLSLCHVEQLSFLRYAPRIVNYILLRLFKKLPYNLIIIPPITSFLCLQLTCHLSTLHSMVSKGLDPTSLHEFFDKD